MMMMMLNHMPRHIVIIATNGLLDFESKHQMLVALRLNFLVN